MRADLKSAVVLSKSSNV